MNVLKFIYCNKVVPLTVDQAPCVKVAPVAVKLVVNCPVGKVVVKAELPVPI